MAVFVCGAEKDLAGSKVSPPPAMQLLARSIMGDGRAIWSYAIRASDYSARLSAIFLYKFAEG